MSLRIACDSCDATLPYGAEHLEVTRLGDDGRANVEHYCLEHFTGLAPDVLPAAGAELRVAHRGRRDDGS